MKVDLEMSARILFFLGFICEVYHLLQKKGRFVPKICGDLLHNSDLFLFFLKSVFIL
ncbi:hypothetical protein IGI67_002690 [Enterococcus sp. AZ196]